MLMYVSSDLAEEWATSEEVFTDFAKNTISNSRRNKFVPNNHFFEKDAVVQPMEIERKKNENKVAKKGKKVPAVFDKKYEEIEQPFPIANLDNKKTPLSEQLTVLNKFSTLLKWLMDSQYCGCQTLK